jgi:hypothetical protein
MWHWQPAVSFVRTLVIVFLVAGASPATGAQGDQGVLAQQFVAGDVETRYRALEVVRRMAPESVSPDLRKALVAALERENAIRQQRYEADKRGELLTDQEAPELIFRISEVVIALRDPQTIPALARALGTGGRIILALADFGSDAVDAVAAVVMSPESSVDAIDEGLIALRLIVEQSQALSRRTRTVVRHVAEHRLRDPGPRSSFGTTLGRAIDLAIALEDPELRAIVEDLARYVADVVARGVTAPQVIEQIQRRAGVPALPRPRQ